MEGVENDEIEDSQTLKITSDSLSYLFLFPPIAYVIYVVIVVWHRGYIPPMYGTTPNERAMRELSLYFLRIVGVFFGVWIPTVVFSALYGRPGETAWAPFASGLLSALQPIATFVAILMKTDAKKYILDLVTLSYLRQKRKDGDKVSNSHQVGTTCRVKRSSLFEGSSSHGDFGARIQHEEVFQPAQRLEFAKYINNTNSDASLDSRDIEDDCKTNLNANAHLIVSPSNAPEAHMNELERDLNCGGPSEEIIFGSVELERGGKDNVE